MTAIPETTRSVTVSIRYTRLNLLFYASTMLKRKKTSFLMGELSKKKHNASTAVRVSLDADLMRGSVDAEESQVVSSSGEKNTR